MTQPLHLPRWWAACAVWAACCSATWAQTPPGPAKPKPLAEILSAVQQRHPGRVVDIDLEQGPDGQRWYEIKMVNGQRSKLYVDAFTGQDIPEPGKATADLVPLPQVLKSLAGSHPGVVLEAELEGGRGEPWRYDIKLLNAQGQPSELRVDARSGKVMLGAWVAPALLQGVLPLDGVLASLEARYKARVTEAELQFPRSQQPHYEVELVLESGRSLELRVDARSGQVIDDAGGRP